eukprot:Skav208410  [mRNA]  locus=scaffold2953:86324:94459:+ [translate_table: standard]
MTERPRILQLLRTLSTWTGVRSTECWPCNRLQAQLLDREPEVQLVVMMLLERSYKLLGNRSSDKTFSPAILVAQAPRAGKNHFLAMLGEKIPVLHDLDGRNQTPIISAFTYNSRMTEDDIENLKTDLALWVLYGAARHMSRTKCEWSDFDGLRPVRLEYTEALLGVPSCMERCFLRPWGFIGMALMLTLLISCIFRLAQPLCRGENRPDDDEAWAPQVMQCRRPPKPREAGGVGGVAKAWRRRVMGRSG